MKQPKKRPPLDKCVRKGCGAEFTPKRRTQRFCSEACRNAAWKRTKGQAPKKRRLEALPSRPQSGLREALPRPSGPPTEKRC